MRPAVRPLSVVGTALALLCAPSVMPAQNSCQPLKDLANRCEGLQRRPNAAPDYELLGLFASAPKQSPSDKYPDDLKLAFHVPEHDKVKAIEVREIVHETFYEMRPKLDALRKEQGDLEEFQGWSTADVLRPSHVRVANLGVLVRLQDPSIPNLLAPAYLFSGEPGTLSSYTIDLVVHRKVEHFACALIDETGKVLQQTEFGVCRFSRSSYSSSEPVRVDIPAAKLPLGLITAHISGDYADDESGRRLDLDVRFKHVGTAGQQP